MLRGKLDLPIDRFYTDGPFTYCGLDMFGPHYIKMGRKQHKRYVALFTYLASRAAHLEPCYYMTTDSFINALRRFITRRGNIRSIRTDNGSNFIGAEHELTAAFLEMDQKQITNFLSCMNCNWIIWKRNPPSGSHMGGIWERMIRSA